MSLPGKIIYQLWHRPLGAVRASLAAGGPISQRRTERGRREMEAAAFTLPALPAESSAPPIELHLLTGRRFWYQTAFCLWTFARQSGRTLAPVIHDDGTLSAPHRDALTRLFPHIRFNDHAAIRARLDEHLPVARFPVLRERWLNYPNIRKLTDVHLASSGWKLVIDSDLLFFHRPQFLLDWLAAPSAPLHAVDCAESYGYTRPLMENLTGAPIPRSSMSVSAACAATPSTGRSSRLGAPRSSPGRKPTTSSSRRLSRCLCRASPQSSRPPRTM